MKVSLIAVLLSLLAVGNCFPQHHPDAVVAKHHEDSFRLAPEIVARPLSPNKFADPEHGITNFQNVHNTRERHETHFGYQLGHGGSYYHHKSHHRPIGARHPAHPHQG